jgi:myo-inositol-1(or 4)-monophosphatase
MCWVVDPIDGTRNFVDRRPEVAISAAFFVNGHVEHAIVGIPRRGLIVSCTYDGVLEVNDQPWSPDPLAPDSLLEATVAIPGDLLKLEAEERQFDIAPLRGKVGNIRCFGALAYDLAVLALGEIDVRISTSAKLVDVAAGVLLVTRSGGVVTDLAGRPWTPASTTILAARTPNLHAEILACLRTHRNDVSTS